MEVPDKSASPESSDASGKDGTHTKAQSNGAPKESKKNTPNTDDNAAGESQPNILAEADIKKEIVTDEDGSDYETDDDATDDGDYHKLVIDESLKAKPTSDESKKSQSKKKETSSNGAPEKESSIPLPESKSPSKKTEVKKPPKKAGNQKPSLSKGVRMPLKVKIVRKNKPVMGAKLSRDKRSLSKDSSLMVATVSTEQSTPGTSKEHSATPISRDLNVENSAWLVPFDLGWRREVVFRGTSEPSPRKKPQADIYYFGPCGSKLRSMPEISNYLQERGIQELSLGNFTFIKTPIHHPPHEVTRQAQQRGFPGSRQSTGTPAKTPKPKKVTQRVVPAVVTDQETTPRAPDVASPATPSTPTENTDSGIISTKRWRKRKALPPDFVSTDQALSYRPPKEQPPSPPHTATPTGAAASPPAQPQPLPSPPQSSPSAPLTPKAKRQSSMLLAAKSVTEPAVITSDAVTNSHTAMIPDTEGKEKELPNSATRRRRSKVKESEEVRQYPSPPGLKKKATHELQVRLSDFLAETRTAQVTRKINLSKLSCCKNRHIYKANGTVPNGISPKTVLPNSDTKLTNLSAVDSRKEKRKRTISKRISDSDFVYFKQEPKSYHETGKVSSQVIVYNGDSLDEVVLDSKDYDRPSYDSDSSFLRKKFVTSRPLISPELDSQLHDFVLDMNSRGLEMSNEALIQRSQEIAISLGFKNFVSSDRFVALWKKRMNVSGNGDQDALNEDSSDTVKEEFTNSFTVLKAKHSYSDTNIGSVCLSYLAGRLGGGNHACSILLSTLATGAKLPAFVVFESKDNVQLVIPSNTIVVTCTEAQTFMDINEKWAKDVWGMCKDPTNRRLLILYEKALNSVSVAEWCLRDCRTDVVAAPTPLTLTWMKDFEVGLLRQYDRFIIQNQGNRIPSQQDLIDWISNSWQNINEEDIISSHQVFSVIGNVENQEQFIDTDHTYDIRHASGLCFVEVYSGSSDETSQEA